MRLLSVSTESEENCEGFLERIRLSSLSENYWNCFLGLILVSEETWSYLASLQPAACSEKRRMMPRLSSLTSVLCVLALLLLPTYGMCPAQCQCGNKTVLCKGQIFLLRSLSSPEIISVLYLQFN